MENQVEIWKDVVGYENLYQISSLGNVKSLNYRRTKQIKILKPAVSVNIGYLSVVLSKDKIKKTFTVHVLVAMAFLKHIPNGSNLVVNHIDFNKLNNNTFNL
jgi:NUMOD4 motif